MIKHGYEGINLEDPLKDKLSQIVEYFVDFYGEAYREKIEDRVKNTKFVFLSRASDEGLLKMKKHFQELKGQAQSKEDIEYLENEEKRLTEILNNNPIRKIDDEFTEKRNEIIFDFISQNLKLEDNARNRKVIGRLGDLYEEMITIDKKLVSQAVKEEYLQMIAAFTSLTNAWDGANLPKDIQEGVGRISSREFAQPVVDKIKELRSIREKKVLADEGLQKTIKEVEDLDLFNGEEIVKFIREFTLSLANVGGGQMTTVENKNTARSKNVCVNSSAMELTDSNFIHEFHHSISASCSLIDGKYVTKCGFCSFTALMMGTGAIDLNSRVLWDKFDALNEIATDYISTKVFKKLNKDGLRIGFNEYEPSIYTAAFPLFEGLFEEHIEDIKESFLGDDPLKWAIKIGFTNFKALADVATKILRFCEFNDVNIKIIDQIKKESGRSDDNFDIFDVAFDDSIKWSKSIYREYLDIYKEADEIFLDIEDELVEANEPEELDEDDYDDEFDDDFDDIDDFDDVDEYLDNLDDDDINDLDDEDFDEDENES